MRTRVSLAATLLLLALAAHGVGAQEEAVAIVVHPATEVDDLTFVDLKSIFRGDRQFWDDGRRVTLLMRAPEAEERKMILERIYEMDEDARRFMMDYLGREIHDAVLILMQIGMSWGSL